jgi:hypothetical protein
MTGTDLPRPLPIRPRPRTAETTASYLRRLAHANHLRPKILDRYLRGTDPDSPIRLDWLAALTGRHPTDLAKALAEHRSEHLPGPLPDSSGESLRQRQARIALFTAIRRDATNNPALSLRFLAERHGVHRRTVRTALRTPTPPPRKPIARRGSRLDRHQTVIDTLLTEPRPGHQRTTIQQVHDHLTKTLHLDVSFSAVSAYVRSRRKHLNQIGKPDRQPSAR